MWQQFKPKVIGQIPKQITRSHRMKMIRKRKFKEANGKCFYCGINCNLIDHKDYLGKTPPEDAATLDHIYHRFDIIRFVVGPYDERYIVLSCKKCNEKKGDVESFLNSEDNYILDYNLLMDIYNGLYNGKLVV